MSNQFAMDKEVLKQLEIIKSLQKRSQAAVYSLYAQAVLEYSLYYHKKDQLLHLIDEALVKRDEEQFMSLTNDYAALLNEHKDGKTIYDHGFKLHLTFQ
ncbi:IDEAL domain-containing protein [Alkalicoccobacillus porphyridii]|uniref:IDEAL domain-containing protein n=1 Tax=Alkalicoccobacillus porphyridii TaxID=2597270 RepID=A0A553ZXI4_9BACI|nr:IDEAL domain-containing protein [Alkalicoccobacillus porphyridii]TSB46168.1 IDEAL domain-containing protein [Alkalicoccobacillus porphyridii]